MWEAVLYTAPEIEKNEKDELSTQIHLYKF